MTRRGDYRATNERRVSYRKKDYPNGGGIYAFFPWDVMDNEHAGIFKIGLSKDFSQRIDNYHTALPGGVYFKAFLVNPTKFQTPGETPRQYLEKIEKEVYKSILNSGGTPIDMEIRKRDLGQTEWIHCGSRAIDKAFSAAHRKFGGELELYNMQMPSEEDRDRDDNLFKGVVYFSR